MFDYESRIRRLQASMAEFDLDLVLLPTGPDLSYFAGYQTEPSERLTMLVIPPDSRATLVVPLLEAPKVGGGPFDLVAWRETESPVALVSRLVGASRRVAIGDHTWSVFLVQLQARLPNVAWSVASPVTKELRIVKEPAELAALRSAADGVDRVLARIPSEVEFAGRSERDIAALLATMTVEEGHESAAFTIVASGPNAASPHHEPTDRIIEGGDLVVCDFGGRWHGYNSDVTRTFAVGTPSAQQEEVYAAVLAASEAANRAIAPGVPGQDVDRAARGVIDAAGFGEYFTHRTGHGIGLEVHEYPYIVEGNSEPLRPGMTFSVEPGVYLPGRFGARIEDIVACGVEGAERLNSAERGLVSVG